MLGIDVTISDELNLPNERYFDEYEIPIYPEVRLALGIEWEQDEIRKNGNGVFKKMRKNVIPECNHIIKDNYYCETCGTLCYNKVI